jgi:hypothetical protein
MAVGPNVGAVFVGTRKSSMYVVTDRDKNRRADDVKTFAPSIGMKIPNGVCFTRDGFLYVIEQNRVLLFPAAEFFYEGSDPAVAVVVDQGKLIPRARSRSTTPPASAASGRTTSSTSRSASRSTCPPLRRLSSTTSRASAALSAWTATARTARSSRAASATR